MHHSPSHDAAIRVYDEAGNVIETRQHAGEFKEGCVRDMDNEAERLKDFERQHRDLSDARIEEEKEKYLPDFPERKILNRILDERGTQREKAARIASRISIVGALAAWVGALAAWALGYWFYGVRIRIIAPNHPLCPHNATSRGFTIPRRNERAVINCATLDALIAYRACATSCDAKRPFQTLITSTRRHSLSGWVYGDTAIIFVPFPDSLVSSRVAPI